MGEVKFTGLVTAGKLDCHERIESMLNRLEGRRVTVSFRDHKRKRSLSQNAYYHRVVKSAVLMVLHNYGNTWADEEIAHEWIKHNFLPPTGRRRIKMEDQEVVFNSTTYLNTGEFEDVMEQVRAWCAEHGVQVPLPNEIPSWD